MKDGQPKFEARDILKTWPGTIIGDPYQPIIDCEGDDTQRCSDDFESFRSFVEAKAGTKFKVLVPLTFTK